MKIIGQNTRTIGNLGEDLACRFLRQKGMDIVDRNYSRKWGEIDVIAKKGTTLHFVEVKSVSCETIEESATREYQPEENIHAAKIRRLERAIGSYLAERPNMVSEDTDWQIDALAVFIDTTHKTAKCRYTPQIVL